MEFSTTEHPTQTLPVPPRTVGFPIIGSIPNVLRQQTDFLFDSWRKLGDVYELDLGLLTIVMLNHPDYAQHIMRDNIRNYAKRVYFKVWRVMMFNYLWCSAGILTFVSRYLGFREHHNKS